MKDNDLEQFLAEVQAANDYMQEWQLRARRVMMPSNPSAWLERAEAALPGKLGRVPSDVAGEFEKLITDGIRHCRHALQRADDQHTKVLFAVLAENIERLNRNAAVRDSNVARQSRSEGGQSTAEARRKEAQERINEAREIWGSLSVPLRNRASIVAARLDVSERTVREWKNNNWQLKKRKAETR